MTSIVFIGGGGRPLSIVKLQSTWSGSIGPPGPTEMTLSIPNLGTPAPDRHIFIAAGGTVGTGLASAKIGGASAFLFPKVLTPASQAIGFMGAWHWPTGSSASVDLVFENDSVKNFTLFVYAVYNLKTLTPISTDGAYQASTALTLDTSVDLQKGGILLGYGRCSSSSAAIASSGVANLEDDWNGSAHSFGFWEDVGATETPRSVVFQKSGTGLADFGAAVFSFR